MAVAIKATAVSPAGSSSVTVPGSVVAGDLLVLCISHFNSSISPPSGFTILSSNSITATYMNYSHVMYKVAVGTEAGTTLSTTMTNPTYAGIILMVITGQSSSSPFANHSTYGGSTSPVVVPGYTTTVSGRSFVLAGEMSNNSTVPTFTAPAGTTLVGAAVGSSGYHRTEVYSYSGDVAAGAQPSASITSNLPGAFLGHMFTVATGNNSATATGLAPNNTFKDNRTTAARFSWTYSDAESNAQYRYEIGYRLKYSTGAWTETTVVSANPYHDFATGTFTLGEEYDWRLRVDDNLGGWSSYYTATFTSGTSVWTYGPETLSSGANVGSDLMVGKGGDFEASNAITLGAWESNPAFGAFVQSTVARTTTKPDTGSYSLEVTLPTMNSSQATIANAQTPGILTIGKLYRLTARVWMQAGGPDFYADMLYQSGQNQPVNTTKGAWTTVTSVFVNTSSNGNQFPGVRTATGTATTSGTKMYVDNVTIHEVSSTLTGQITPAEVGEYYIQVRTADHKVFSPWSSTHTAMVNPLSNKFVKVGGVWVVSTVQQKVAGVWEDVQPSKVKSGGVFS